MNFAAGMLFKKAETLLALGREEEAIAAYEQLIADFDNSEHPEVAMLLDAADERCDEPEAER